MPALAQLECALNDIDISAHNAAKWRIRKAIAVLRSISPWRPMEDAPRDGTPILIRRHNDVSWDYFVAWHVTGDEKYPWHSDINAYPEHRCDHWMAIPEDRGGPHFPQAERQDTP